MKKESRCESSRYAESKLGQTVTSDDEGDGKAAQLAKHLPCKDLSTTSSAHVTSPVCGCLSAEETERPLGLTSGQLSLTDESWAGRNCVSENKEMLGEYRGLTVSPEKT